MFIIVLGTINLSYYFNVTKIINHINNSKDNKTSKPRNTMKLLMCRWAQRSRVKSGPSEPATTVS